jgi:hypothetical protein
LKKQISLKWKIGRYLVAFAILTVAVVFLFQVVLLEPMYERSKIQAVKGSIGFGRFRQLPMEMMQQPSCAWQHRVIPACRHIHASVRMEQQAVLHWPEMADAWLQSE